MNRKKKLRYTQLALLFIGTLIIFFTYSNINKSSKERILSKSMQEKVENQLSEENKDGDVFYNIEYSGLDLAGNRYSLKSEEAFNEISNPDNVIMKKVSAVFYFKDDTILKVSSERGIYNNKSLDMNFYDDVKADYEGSKLFAEIAEYSNSKSFLTISNNVKIKDIKGTMLADKLLFDIKSQKLNIASFNDGTINANINLK
tara:strand:- start:20 stop:622 length:603 start_codon:yes stop_codon:yes gene_type:complete